MIKTFENRLQIAKIAGFPDQTFFMGLAGIGVGAFGVIAPSILLKIPLLVASVGSLYVAYDYYINRNNWLVRRSLDEGKRLSKRSSFSTCEEQIMSDEHCYHSRIGDYGITHKNNTVSVVIKRNGDENYFAGPEELEEEQRIKLGMLKLASDMDIVTENHWYNTKNDFLIDKYLAYQESINKDSHPIVMDNLRQYGEQYRGKAKKAVIYTVITKAVPDKHWIFSLLKPTTNDARGLKKCYETVLDFIDLYKGEDSSVEPLDQNSALNVINKIAKPYSDDINVDYKFDFSEQVITHKYTEQKDHYSLGEYHFKSMVLQNYPDLPPNWFRMFCAKTIDIHISQIVIPKDTEKSTDSASKKIEDESKVSSSTKGQHSLALKVRDTIQHGQYLAQRNIPSFDNAYIVTFFSKDEKELRREANRFKQVISKNNGQIRDDLDLQLAMLKHRLPGEGIYTSFKRDDHADCIMAMMPTTVQAKGSEKPECLWLNDCFELITTAPSELKVAHKMVVADTGGGKDSQEGKVFFETFNKIRYDAVEFGNTYQGAYEAVGGRYCSAKDMIINPLLTYKEVQSAKQLATSEGKKNIYASTRIALVDTIKPVFKQFGEQLNNAEKSVIGQVIDLVYAEKNHQKESPTLPDLLAYFDKVETVTESEKVARDILGESLNVFIRTPIGSCFAEEEQYEISPVANAIDFWGLDDELFRFQFGFAVPRLANNAMAMGGRNQILFNEYKVMIEKAPEVVADVTMTIDRMGRKEATGLTRISQGLAEIQSVDPEAINSIRSTMLLSRKSDHSKFAEALNIPFAVWKSWERFIKPETLIKEKKNFREGILFEMEQWHQVYLKFPQLHLDIMNTDPDDRDLRFETYSSTKDPYERISLFKQLKEKRKQKILLEKENYEQQASSTNNSFDDDDFIL